MRFLLRAFGGAVTLGLCVLLVGLGAVRFFSAGGDGDDRKRPAMERAFTVRTAPLVAETVQPVTVAYGEAVAGREVELRAGAAGRISAISEAFQVGRRVSEGQELARIDPANGESKQADAQAQLADARSREAAARSAVASAAAELEAMRQQTALRQAAYDRQKKLFDRGLVSRAGLETAELALAAARQSEAARAQATEAAKAQATQAGLSAKRAGLSVSDAKRNLGETRLIAPFAGVIAEAAAAEGRLVGANERLGVLTDLSAMEVKFQISGADFARMTGPDGRLAPLSVSASLDLGEAPTALRGTLDRAAPQVADGGGRTLFARLQPLPEGGFGPLRPGDFVTLRVEEPPLENIARIPAKALDDKGRALLMGADGRLEEAQAQILRRQGADLIVTGLPFGRTLVADRTPQLGPGVKARDAADADPRGGGRPGGGKPGGEPGAEAGGDTIALDEERRARLIAFVEGNRRMPEDRKAATLAALKEPMVPRETVERLESRMNGGGGRP